MMDAEKGDEGHKVTGVKSHKLKRVFTPKKIMIGSVLLICTLAVMFGMGVLAARYAFDSNKAVVVSVVEKQAPSALPTHALARRDDDCDEEHESAADAATASMISYGHLVVSDIDDGEGVSVPISTIYSLSKPIIVTETQTMTAVVTIEPSTSLSLVTFETSAEVCSFQVVTKTASFTVTVYPTPTPSSSSFDDATVVGPPETVTAGETDVLFTTGLPDATVSGNPETVTDVQTEVSVTSGLPDATVSGNPETVTDVQTDVSVTSGLPDATVSGIPGTVTDVQTSFSITSSSSSPVNQPTTITISDLYPPAVTHSREMSTVTAFITISKTTTKGMSTWVSVTVIESYPPVASSNAGAIGASSSSFEATPTSTFTKVVTVTDGTASPSTTTILVPVPPYPSTNGTTTTLTHPSGTIITVPPTSPVVISGGNKKPEPRGWGGSNGTTNLGCTIMLIALIMFSL